MSCWLDDAGRVECLAFAFDPSAPPTTSRYFAQRPVLALAVNPYSSAREPGSIAARCGVYNDGSLWCIGDNEHGQLGVEQAALFEETEVAPAGSARINCPDLAPQ